MSSPVVANIVNATIGLTSAFFHLWHYFRRGRNSESLWAMLLSLSASFYAIAMLRLYAGYPGAQPRVHFQVVYLLIGIFFWSIFGYAMQRAQIKWSKKFST